MADSAPPVNQLHNSLEPDYLDHQYDSQNDSDYEICSAFRDIRRKTLRSLYGIEDENDITKVNYKLLLDKSPKGSVDEGIRSLVDLINAHPSFATLSSCSGRISLFDPNHHSKIRKDDDLSGNNELDSFGEDREEISNQNNGGKGYGAWLISSHAKITSEQLIDVLDYHAEAKNRGHALMFKHEPLLLHIAASNMVRARQLLTIAFNLGFRESGLVVTPKRITVAIRTHSLSLCVPISSSGNLRPTNAYLVELVTEANERFNLNEQKLNALELDVRKNLFQCGIQYYLEEKLFNIKISSLPDLNLWGHSAVAIPIDHEDETGDVDLIAIGGFGIGPVIDGQNRKHSNHSSRLDKVFGLKRKNKRWDTFWHEFYKEEGNNSEALFHGIKTKQISFTAREGHASCILKLPSNNSAQLEVNTEIIATFGGRESPSRPLNEFSFMMISQRSVKFFKPIDIRGEHPTARWGHTFTALSGRHGKVAILIGGRNENSVLNSIHLLSCRSEVDLNQSKNVYFYWETIDVIEHIPRFQHSSVLVPNLSSCTDEDEKILVFGGLTSLALFDHSDVKDAENDQCNGVLSIIIHKDSRASINHSNMASSYYGASTCLLTTNISANKEKLLIRIGGLSFQELSEESQSELDLFTLKDGDTLLQKCKYKFEDTCNLGSSMTPILLETPVINDSLIRSLVVIGGGVPMFAFGQSFAKSFLITITLKKPQVIVSSIERLQTKGVNKNGKLDISTLKSNENSSKETHVIFVRNKKAKELKMALEALGFLDRRFRMTKAEDSTQFQSAVDMIAVPIIDDFHSIIGTDDSTSWTSLVEGSGTQKMPFSTAVLGNK